MTRGRDDTEGLMAWADGIAGQQAEAEAKLCEWEEKQRGVEEKNLAKLTKRLKLPEDVAREIWEKAREYERDHAQRRQRYCQRVGWSGALAGREAPTE